MKKTIFITLLLIFCAVATASAQTSTVAGIDAYCKTIDKMTEKSKTPDIVFADVSDYEKNEKEKWQKFASEAALEKFRETTETYTIALNWRKNGHLVASNFTLSSPSGDWAKYVFQYFREDGTLAKAKSELRTFNGELSVTEVRYFNSKGTLLKKTLKYADLTTGKPKNPGKEYRDGSSGSMKEKDYYMSTRKLPFAKLLAAK